MNRVHSAVLRHIRDASSKEEGKIASTLTSLTDEQIVRMMFSSYRGRDGASRGMRLTNIGLEIMKSYFTFFEIKMPENHMVQSGELIYLDRRATLPYFFSNDRIVVFETELGIKLKLADGDIPTLIEMEVA